jgi:hypothetical protein
MNEALRSHVTRVGFDLTLGKTHIAALVYLNECLKQRRYIPAHKTENRPLRHTFAFFASGAHGLQDRGLILHHYRPDKHDAGLKWHYTITKAGKLVVALLQEAGIYQEYADALPRLEVVV